ncbi:desampylase [Saliphagus sp. GCM10025334]
MSAGGDGDGDGDDESGRGGPGESSPRAATLVLPDSIERAILEAARASAPEECCGVLGGEFGPDVSHARSHYPARNVADEPRTRYRIDPEEQLAIFERLEARDEEIVGFYHSHPRGPPGPSATDAEWAAWPGRSYVIISLEGSSGDDDDALVRSWRWRDASDEDGQFERERLEYSTIS